MNKLKQLLHKQRSNSDSKRNFSYYWKLIRDALNGSEQDFTSLRLSKAIILLAIPMVLEMTMESVFAIVDIFFVSKLGSDAVATIGLTESLMTLVYALGIGFSAGTTAIVARRIGEKNEKEAARSAIQAIFLGIFASFIFSIPGILFPKQLLLMMGATQYAADNYSGFTAIMLGSNAVIMLLFIINAVFRSAGNAAISLRVLVLANSINIILDPILIFGLGPIPAFGIEGAAIATATGRGIGVLFQIYMLIIGKGRIRIRLHELTIHWSTMLQLVKLSTGGIAQYLIATASWVGLVRIISIFGSGAVAGYTIAFRIIAFMLLPSWGLSNAAATLVGQNLGAEKPFRAERSAWITGFFNMGFLGIISLILIIFPHWFITFFSKDASVIEHGVQCLQIVSYGFLFYAMGMVMSQSLNGAGDTFTPTLLNFICFWIIEVPLAYLLSITFHLESGGVYYAIIIAESILTILSAYMFYLGKWKLKKV